MVVTVPLQVLYALMDRLLLCSGVMIIFKKSMQPSGLVCSVVNLMAWSMVLMCCRSFFVFCLLSDKGVIHISHMTSTTRTDHTKYNLSKLLI